MSIISDRVRGRPAPDGRARRLRKMATGSDMLLVHCYRMDMFTGHGEAGGAELEVMDREYADISGGCVGGVRVTSSIQSYKR